jgi:asparagine synthase (glutamine-hydrolysing)
MCGIAGVVGHPDTALVHRMCEVMVHRGPDGAGFYTDDGATLGMRRLAIIDVAGGHQPVRNEDGSVVAVFNGEIYNFADLRTALIRRGHRFSTAGDSECLVHLYEEYGDEFVTRLRGMFAFAIWDVRRRRLLLGRDRVGKKPLYWRGGGADLQFASEAKSLLEDPSLARRLDLVALHHYLTYQYVPAPWSIYQGVHKLPPGHLLIWQDGRVDVRRYWRLDSTPRTITDTAAAEEELRDLLLDAVRVRLVAERPLGALLSGGVDSSAVVAAMSMVSPGPVRTFSIGFDEYSLDERAYARVVARRYATDHHEFVVTGCDADLLAQLAWHYDEPFGDPSAIPSFHVARLSREHVTVVLNGDGGDECFGGYPRYALMRRLSRVPTVPPHPLLSRCGDLAGRALNGRLSRRLSRAVQLLGQPAPERYGSLMSIFTAAQKHDLYTDDLRTELAGVNSLDLLGRAYARSTARDTLGRLIDTDVNTYLPGDLLAKMDIATMANSVEARSPFLDHVLLEWAAHLPTNLKVRRGTTKYLLKRAVSPWLPPAVIDRPKRGFGVPLARWLRTSLRDLAWSVLTDQTAEQRGLFRPEAVVAMLQRHERGYDESRRLWALIQSELWHRVYLDPPTVRPTPAMSARTSPALTEPGHLAPGP